MTEVLASGLDELRAAVRGAVIGRDDAEYDSARALYNAMIDKRPAMIVRCVDVADVIAAVELRPRARARHRNQVWRAQRARPGQRRRRARDRPVRAEGSPRRSRDRNAEVAGGCVMGDIDHATHPFGMAVPSGIISTTGVGGIILGGGIGHLTRKYGLSIDNILGADVVLADGSLVRADENDQRGPVLGDPRRRRQLRRRDLAP